MTENKRFVTGGYKIYDTYKEEEYLVNNVDTQRIVDTMNNLDLKARERSKALSKLQKENEQLKHDATVLIQANTDYRKENEQLREMIDKLFDYFAKWFEEERGIYIEEFGMLWKDICMGDDGND